MTYKPSKKVSVRVPPTKITNGRRGSKKSVVLKSARGMSGGRRPTLGEQFTQDSARTYPGK